MLIIPFSGLVFRDIVERRGRLMSGIRIDPVAY